MKDDRLAQIKIKYSIIDDDPSHILSDLRQRIKERSQDMNREQLENKRDFRSEEERVSYSSLVEDEKYVQDCIHEIVPLSNFKDIIESDRQKTLDKITEINKELILSSKQTTYRNSLSEKITQNIRDVKYSNLIPKISITTITGILTFLWIVPSTIQNHPILSQFINLNSQIFTLLWIELLVLFSLFWCFMYLIEKCQKELIKKLNDESFQNTFFMHFITERNKIKETNDDNLIISNLFDRQDLIDYLEIYFYSIIKKSSISLFKCSFYKKEDLARNETLNDIIYSQIYQLRGDYEFGKKPITESYEGEISFDILIKLDKKPTNSLQKRFLMNNFEKNFESDTKQDFINSILLKAEERGIIELIRTYSGRTFGDIYKIKDLSFMNQ